MFLLTSRVFFTKGLGHLPTFFYGLIIEKQSKPNINYQKLYCKEYWSVRYYGTVRQTIILAHFDLNYNFRKTPALTPFSSGYEVDTIEQLKRAVRSKVEKIPETANEISPYATSNLQTLPVGPAGRNTLGR